MPRTAGFVVVSVLFVLTAMLATASLAPAQEPPDQPVASDGQTDDQTSDAGADADAAPEDEEIEDLEDLPAAEDGDTTRQSKQAEDGGDADGEGDGEGDTAQAESQSLSCDDFDTQEEAQDYFTDEGGSDTNNVDGLDEDSDGVACEALGAPTGGIDAGAGGTAPGPEVDGSSPLPFLLGGAALGLAFGALSLAALRRRAGE